LVERREGGCRARHLRNPGGKGRLLSLRHLLGLRSFPRLHGFLRLSGFLGSGGVLGSHSDENKIMDGLCGGTRGFIRWALYRKPKPHQCLCIVAGNAIARAQQYAEVELGVGVATQGCAFEPLSRLARVCRPTKALR
jgi:hypothetical protein